MNIRTDRLSLSFSLCSLVSLLCMASVIGCAPVSIAPASKLSSGKVTLSWNNSPGAITYNIYFSRLPGVTKSNGFKIRNATSPMTILDLEPGRTYYFVMTVVDEKGESDESIEKSFTAAEAEGSIHFDDPMAKKQAPQAHMASGRVPDGQATLSWEDVPNAAYYNIYWRTSPGVTKLNGKKIEKVKNPHTMKGLEPGKKYYFVITAVKGSAESGESEEVAFNAK